LEKPGNISPPPTTIPIPRFHFELLTFTSVSFVGVVIVVKDTKKNLEGQGTGIGDRNGNAIAQAIHSPSMLRKEVKTCEVAGVSAN